MVLCLLSSLGMLIRAEIPWECRPSDRRLGPAAFTLLRPISEVPAGGRIGTKVNLGQVPMCVPGVQPVRADSIFHAGPFTSLLTSLCSRSCPTGHLTATGSILKGQPDHASPLLKSLQRLPIKAEQFQFAIRIFKALTNLQQPPPPTSPLATPWPGSNNP